MVKKVLKTFDTIESVSFSLGLSGMELKSMCPLSWVCTYNLLVAAQSSDYANLPFWSFFKFITEYWPTFTRNRSLKKPFSLSCTRDFSPFFSISEIFISVSSSWAKFLQTFIGICLSGGLYRRVFNNLLP